MSYSVTRSVTEDLDHLRNMVKAAGTKARGVQSLGVSPSNMYGGGGGTGQAGSRYFGTAQQQYRANRDTVYTAIRPGAIKAASQPWQVGYTGGKPEPEAPDKMEKAAYNEWARRRLRHRHVRKHAPDFVQKNFRDDRMKPLDEHPIYDLFENPNDFFDGWATVYCTYFSIELTGRSYWLINAAPDRPSGMELYYLPSHWVKPNHTEERLYESWQIQPSGGEGFEVPFESIVYMAMPNPASPVDTYASLQSQARAVNIEDQILNAQFEGLNNGIHPSVILKAGMLPGIQNMTQANRPILTPEQRKQLITAVALATQGPLNYREPFIVDGLIEDVIPYSLTPAEMDFQSSTALTQDRIMSGFGTNPYTTGRIENANRATAAVAKDSAYDLQINPIINLISRAASRRIAPLFDGTSSKMKIWIEEARSSDPDHMLSRVSLAPEIIPKGVLRRYMMTGELVIPELDDDEEMMADMSDAGDDEAFNDAFGDELGGDGDPQFEDDPESPEGDSDFLGDDDDDGDEDILPFDDGEQIRDDEDLEDEIELDDEDLFDDDEEDSDEDDEDPEDDEPVDEDDESDSELPEEEEDDEDEEDESERKKKQ